MAQRIVLDEENIKKEFLQRNAEFAEKAVKSAKKRRIDELSQLMQIAYEDRMKGKMPEDICVEFILLRRPRLRYDSLRVVLRKTTPFNSVSWVLLAKEKPSQTQKGSTGYCLVAEVGILRYAPWRSRCALG